jgi:hypothetical protein
VDRLVGSLGEKGEEICGIECMDAMCAVDATTQYGIVFKCYK